MVYDRHGQAAGDVVPDGRTCGSQNAQERIPGALGRIGEYAVRLGESDSVRPPFGYGLIQVPLTADR